MAKVVKVKTGKFEGLTLDLDAEEVEFLYRLLRHHVVGSGKWRGISSNIHYGLEPVCKTFGVCGDKLGEGCLYLGPNSKDEE
jgi:hypothetical protein